MDWEHADPEVLGGWLEGAIAHKLPMYSLHTLSRRFEHIEGTLKSVYPEVARLLNKGVRKGNIRELSIRSDWLDAASLAKTLKALRPKPTHLDAMMCDVVAQGVPEGLTAIAELLADDKASDAALFWLAAAGPSGLRAARERWEADKGAKGKAARAKIEALEALPLGATPTDGPHHFLPSDLTPWERPLPELPPGPSEPALAKAKLQAMCSGWSAPPCSRKDLSPEEWADYLQVSSMDDFLTHVGASWELAREAGWLGRGADPRFLLAAGHRLTPDGRAHWNRASKIGHGHLFLWAGADRDAYVAALALSLRFPQLRRTMGWIEENWCAPLEHVNPPWKDEVLEFARRLSQNNPLLGPVVERPDGEVIGWDATRHDLFAAVPAGGEARMSSGGQTVVIAPSQGRLELIGPAPVSRRFPPVPGPFEVGFTNADDGLHLHFGSVTWGKVPIAPGPSEITGVTNARLRRVATGLWNGMRRLVAEEDAQAAPWLAEVGGEPTARLLALVAELRPHVQTEAVRAALAGLGDVAAPYLARLGIAAEAPQLPDRDFAAVVAALKSNTKGGVRERDGWYVVAGHGFTGPYIQHIDAGEPLSPAEIVREAQGCPNFPYFEEPGDVRWREMIGVREVTWKVIPSDEEGVYDGPLFYEMHAAVWSVRDGQVLAVWSGYDVTSPHWLLGLPYMPVASWQPLG